MATSNSKIVSFSMGARDRKVTRVSFNVTAVNDVLFSGGCKFDRYSVKQRRKVEAERFLNFTSMTILVIIISLYRSSRLPSRIIRRRVELGKACLSNATSSNGRVPFEFSCRMAIPDG